jgi:hypothetical protein
MRKNINAKWLMDNTTTHLNKLPSYTVLSNVITVANKVGVTNNSHPNFIKNLIEHIMKQGVDAKDLFYDWNSITEEL